MQKQIHLAGGCFWGVEKYMAQQDGVIATEVGYANGHTTNPTYEEVCTGGTGFAEAVCITYDAAIIGLDALLALFYKVIDPTIKNRQGGDIGSQYRTGVYYINQDDAAVITKSLTSLQKDHKAPIVTENQPLANYYKAEEYHQKYLDKNPGGYCHIPEEMYNK